MFYGKEGDKCEVANLSKVSLYALHEPLVLGARPRLLSVPKLCNFALLAYLVNESL